MTSSIQVSEEMIAAGVDALKANFPTFTYESAARECYLAMRSKDHSIADDDVREKVARAIAEAAGDDPDLPSLSQHTLLMRGEGAKIWEEWLPEADAAITAIGSQSIERERG